MKYYHKITYTLLFFTLVFIVACVTINIYFPAEKVKSVAKDIVKDIRGGKSRSDDTAVDKTSFLENTATLILPSIAFADDVTNVSNPIIRTLKERMKQRFYRLKPYYQKGLLKEQDNGYVKLVNTKGLNLKQKRDIKNLVKAENADRHDLYLAVARAMNISPSDVNKVARIFAEQWKKSLK